LVVGELVVEMVGGGGACVVVGALVVVVGALVVVAGLLVVGTVLNSERSDLEVQPGSLRSTLPSRSLSRPSEHCGSGDEVEVVDTGSVEVVVEPSPKGNASGVSGEGNASGVGFAGSGCERVRTKIKNGIAASAKSSKTFTIGLRSLNDMERSLLRSAICFTDTRAV
jgi:hypothetical protein